MIKHNKFKTDINDNHYDNDINYILSTKITQ